MTHRSSRRPQSQFQASSCVTFSGLFCSRLLLGGFLTCALAAGAVDPATALRVDETLRHSLSLSEDLQSLCDGIGPRMSGTRGMRDALKWGRQAFSAAGLVSVRLEPVRMPLRWEEGSTRVEILLSPAFSIRGAASALSPALPESLDLDLVDGGRGDAGTFASAPVRFDGAVALVELKPVRTLEELATEQRRAMVALREASDAGVRAVLYVSTRSDGLLYRHVNNIAGVLDPIPSAVIGREDGLRLLALLRSGERIRVRLALPNQIGGPYDTANVVGEIPGVQEPEEIVVLGAHLDSWDMGSGCLDNAVNVALVTHVARSIVAAGVRPTRTLRFVLFGGEEFGLFGSRAYVERHRSELSRHVAVVVHDMGGGPLIGYSTGGRDDLEPQLRTLVDAALGTEADQGAAETHFFSDNFPFLLAGVPALFGIQDVSEYIRPYHSEADTLEQVQPSEVLTAAAVAADLLLDIASRPERFGQHLDREEVRDWLRRSGLGRHLRFLGVSDSWLLRAEGADKGSR